MFSRYTFTCLQECVPSAPYPGDGVDNDCNGEIDETQCTGASNCKYPCLKSDVRVSEKVIEIYME